MIYIDMKDIPEDRRFDFAWLDKRIVDCLACNKRVHTINIRDLYACRRCGSVQVKVVKAWRIPYRTLTQARDEGKLLVYPGNPTETNFEMLADWRDFPSVVKKNSRNQIKTNKRSNTNEKHPQTGIAGADAMAG